MKKFFFTVTILLQIVSIGRSQESIFNIFDGILPRSTGTTPNVAALKSDVESDINYQTGSINVKFPIHYIDGANFSFPISLVYNNSGLLVNSYDTPVGKGWTLNAGGYISRIIRGSSDFRSWRNHSSYNFYNLGGLFHNPDIYVFGSPLGVNGCNVRLYPDQEWEVNCTPIMNGLNLSLFDYDTEPDWFFYNFSNFSGEFSLKQTQVLSPNNIPFKVITFPSNDDSQWVLEDYKGNRLFFSVLDESTRHISYENPLVSVTAWNLSRITTPEGQSVEFEYITSEHTESMNSNTINQKYIFSNSSHSDILKNHLKQIKFYNGNEELLEEIEFDYEFDRIDNDLIPRLKSISISLKGKPYKDFFTISS